MGWIDTELVFVSLAAMVSPTTLTFSVLALVLGNRPLRTGLLFFSGAFAFTIAVGIAAAFLLGDAAASHTPSSPKTWVAIVDIVAAAVILGFVVRWLRRPANPTKTEAAVAQMSKIADSPWIAVVGAGAMLANPGGFIPIALKTISETNPGDGGLRRRMALLHCRRTPSADDRACRLGRRSRMGGTASRPPALLARGARPDDRRRDLLPPRRGAPTQRHLRPHELAARDVRFEA